MSEQAQTKTTTHDDGKFVRTALVIGPGQDGGSVDVLDPSGHFLARINLFTHGKDDPDGLWFAVDVIDMEDQFNYKRALIFEDGGRQDMETTGNLVAADFRVKP